jgi:hypothetical protein
MPIDKLERRKKILAIFNRKQLNMLSDRLSPDHADRATLVEEIVREWPAEKIRSMLRTMLAGVEREE